MDLLESVFWVIMLFVSSLLNCLIIVAAAVLQIAGFEEQANKIFNKF
jgi:hypothetical protein